MHDRVERPAALVDAAADRLGHLAIVAEIDPHRLADRVLGQVAVEVEHRIAAPYEVAQHGPSEFAAAAGDDDLGHAWAPVRAKAGAPAGQSVDPNKTTRGGQTPIAVPAKMPGAGREPFVNMGLTTGSSGRR